MTRPLAIALVCAQMLLAGCGGSAANGGDGEANLAAMMTPAPCPSPGEVDALAGIEGWAPGAGQASKMGEGASQQMGGFGSAFGGEAAATPTPAPSPSDGGCRSFTPRLSAALAKAAEDRKKIPATGYDVAARAATLTTPEAAFAFVRDDVRTDAYAGSMRGARGTLMAAAGSSADKAELLHDLLAAQNVPSRFVHASLADGDAAKVVAAALAPEKIPDGAVFAGSRAKDAIAEGVAVAKTSLAKVRAMLDARGIKLGDAGAVAALTKNVRDHWWLQAQIGGAWTDLDPTLAGAKSGTHLGPAPAEAPADALPDAIVATIAVALVADTGAATPQTLAHVSSAAPAAIEAPISVAMNGDVSDFSAIPQQTSFVPSVAIGDDASTGEAFTPDAGAARLRALYLDVTVTVPGRAPIAHRHVVVDRRAAGGGIDPSWTPERTAYALTFAYRGVESVGDMDPAYSVGVNVDAMLRSALAADYAAQHPGATDLPDAAFSTYPYEAHKFFGYDQSIRGAMMQADPTLAWIYDRPLVAFYRQSFDKRADGLRFVQTFDIVDNTVLAFANGALVPDANAERGLMDTSVEESLISGPGTRIDTAAVFAAAKGQSIGVVPASDRVSLPPGAVAIAPSSPVAVGGVPSYGWLEVDPKTGNVVGRMQSGAGQAMVERSVLEKMLEKYSAIKAFGRCVNCFFSTFGEALVDANNGQKGDSGEHFVQCTANAICQFAVDYAFDWFYVHGFEMEGPGFGLITGPYLDIGGEVIGGGPTGAICDLGVKNPYSRPIIG